MNYRFLNLRRSRRNQYNSNIFCDTISKGQHEARKYLKCFKKTWCKYSKKGTCRRRGCPFAHSQDNLILKERYNNNKYFKEQPCSQKDCQRFNCKFYHNIQEKRINICLNNLKQEKGWKVSKRILIISEAIPYLSYFQKEEIQEIIQQIRELKINQEAKLGYSLNGIEINLLQTKSQFVKESQWEFIESFKDVDKLFFKSREISYFRISSKKQVTLIVNNGFFVNQMCQELRLRAPSNLRLVIKSVDKDWLKLCNLLEAVSYLKNSLYKLELDIRDLIGPTDLPDLESKLKGSLLPLIKLRAIKLSFKMDFTEENGGYEKDLIDIALELLREMEKASCINLEVKLSMFGISVLKKAHSLSVLSDPCQRSNAKGRKQLTQRLQYRILHCHLINKFSKLFLKYNKVTPQSLNFDFRHIYGLSSNPEKKKQKIFLKEKRKPLSKVDEEPQKDYRKINAIKYVKEIDSLLEEVMKMVSLTPKNSINKFSLKFFAFNFFFESNSKKKLSSFSLKSACLLPSQNRPIFSFKSFFELASLIRQKLNLTFNNQILLGNIGRKIEEGDERSTKQFISQVQNGNITFLTKMMGSFNSLIFLKCPNSDLGSLSEIIQFSKKPINCSIKFQFDYEMKQKRIVAANQIACLFRQRIIDVLKKYKAIQRQHPTFTLRKEIIFDILQDLKLGKDDANAMFNDLIAQVEKQKKERRQWGWDEQPEEIPQIQPEWQENDQILV